METGCCLKDNKIINKSNTCSIAVRDGVAPTYCVYYYGLVACKKQCCSLLLTDCLSSKNAIFLSE